MKREYDFSNAVRGKFFRKGAELNVPIDVDGPLHKRLERLAKKKGKPVTDLVNQLLKRDVAGKPVVTPGNQASHRKAARPR